MIRFLKNLWSTFKGSSVKQQSSDRVSPSERISRYILHRKGRFSREKRRVKPAAFLPPPNLEMSVYRTGTLDEPEIREIGNKYVAEPQDKKIYLITYVSKLRPRTTRTLG